MAHEVSVERPGGAAERHAITGPTIAGGSRADALLLPGAPPGALRLVPCATGLVVEAAAPGARVAGHPVAPGARRLLRPGQRAEISGAAIALSGRAPAGGETRVAAAALLGDAAAGAATLDACLVVLTGPRAGVREPLGAERTVGRGRAADLRIPDPRASRVHARVRAGPSGITVEDLGSKNGVLVNGVRIDRRRVPLCPGDELRLGDTSLAIDGPPGAAPGAPAEPAGAGRSRRRISPHAAAAALLALCAAALALAAP